MTRDAAGKSGNAKTGQQQLNALNRAQTWGRRHDIVVSLATPLMLGTLSAVAPISPWLILPLASTPLALLGLGKYLIRRLYRCRDCNYPLATMNFLAIRASGSPLRINFCPHCGFPVDDLGKVDGSDHVNPGARPSGDRRQAADDVNGHDGAMPVGGAPLR